MSVNGESTKSYCPVCGVWEIAANDLYCGWCGHKFEHYRLEIKDKVYVFKPEITEVTVHVTLENLQLRDATIHKFDFSDKDYVTIESPALSYPYILKKGEALELDLLIDTVTFTEQEKKVEIIFYSDLQNEPIRETIRFAPSPKFALSFPDKELTFTVDNDENEIYAVKIEITEGCVEFEKPVIEPEWLVFSSDSETKSGKYFLDAFEGPKTLEGFLTADKKELQETWSKSKENRIEGQFHIYAKEELLVEQSLICKISVPPLLNIKGAERLSDVESADQVFRINASNIWLGTRLRKIALHLFDIENTGGEALKIKSIQVNNKPGWFYLSKIPEGKEILSSKQLLSIGCDIDLYDILGGLYNIELLITSNHGKKDNHITKCIYHVKTESVSEFSENGMVAFDFGTTNSCCVVQKEDEHGSSFHLLPLDWGTDPFSLTKQYNSVIAQNSKKYHFTNDQDSIPSMIYYLRKEMLNDNEIRDYTVGKAVEANISSANESSIVLSIKSQLGTGKKLTIEYAERDHGAAEESKLYPEEISSDIINTLLGRAEYVLGKKINKCNFSHPVGFVRERIEALKKAFELAGIQDISDDSYWPEPLCAAYYFISQEIIQKYKNSNQAHHEDYVLVFDFGGGTTDISYVKIDCERDKYDVLDIKPKIIDLDGHRRFGGDNITQIIFSHFWEQVQKEYDDDIPVSEPFGEDITGDYALQKIGKSNFYLLWRNAEDAKVELSEGSKKYENTFNVRTKDDKLAPVNMHITLDEMNEIVRPKLEELCSIIKDVLKRNEKKISKNLPDYIVLSGNSCRMPLVKEVISEAFPSVNIKFPRKIGIQEEDESNYALKECVAIGLCQLAMDTTRSQSVVLEKPEKVDFSTMELGITEYVGFKRVFNPIVKKGDDFKPWREPEHRIRIKPKTSLIIVEKITDDVLLPIVRYAVPVFKDWNKDDYKKALLKLRITKDYELEVKITVEDDKTGQVLKEAKLEKVIIKPTEY